MRTTVRLDDDLLTAAKRTAAAQHTSLTALIEDSLRQTLAEQADRGPETQRFSGTRRQALDPGEQSSLRELMEPLLR